MDKILFYASSQQLNVKLSKCQLFNQWDFIDFLKKPIKKQEKLLLFASFLIKFIYSFVNSKLWRLKFPSSFSGI